MALNKQISGGNKAIRNEGQRPSAPVLPILGGHKLGHILNVMCVGVC